MEKTYKILRKAFDRDDELIESGLSLQDAQAHCSNPETSSRTCTSDWGHLLTEKIGAWFDAYEEDCFVEPKCQEGKHEPDFTSISHDVNMSNVIDINCKHCGLSGSVSINSKDILW